MVSRLIECIQFITNDTVIMIEECYDDNMRKIMMLIIRVMLIITTICLHHRDHP